MEEQARYGETTLTLPSGRVATVRPGTGRDLRLAGRVANPAEDPILFAFAMAAQRCTVDGAAVVAEDLDDWPADDVQVLLQAVGGKVPTPGISTG